VSNVVPFLSGLSPSIIPEEDVTISRLSAILEAAFIDHEVDESGDLCVTDGLEYPLWVTIDAARRLLHLLPTAGLTRSREQIGCPGSIG
jgi:hypothetical protein